MAKIKKIYLYVLLFIFLLQIPFSVSQCSCSDPEDCAGFCDDNTDECAPCSSDSECEDASRPVCSGGRCVQCVLSSECTNPTYPTCFPGPNICGQCLVDVDCPPSMTECRVNVCNLINISTMACDGLIDLSFSNCGEENAPDGTPCSIGECQSGNCMMLMSSPSPSSSPMLVMSMSNSPTPSLSEGASPSNSPVLVMSMSNSPTPSLSEGASPSNSPGAPMSPGVSFMSPAPEPEEIDCNDFDPCTIDTVEENDDGEMVCKNKRIDCEPADDCSIATCIAGECVQQEKCTTDNPCETVECNDEGKCIIGSIEFMPPNPCVLVSCNVTDGSPIFANKTCEDFNPCTDSYCDEMDGECKHDPIECEPPMNCTIAELVLIDNETCECKIKDKECDDGDPCTLNNCIFANDTCSNPPKCMPEDSCSTVDCIAGLCVPQTVCTPPNNCYNFTCTPMGMDFECEYEYKCPMNTTCLQYTCDPEGAGFCTEISLCDDGDPCTIDMCDIMTGNCTHVFKCDDGDPCTEDICNGGQCFNRPICNDFDPCTDDTCNPFTLQCMFTDKCVPMDNCTIVTCGVGGNCIETPKCFDGDPCTIDNCAVNGTCSFEPFCPMPTDPCLIPQCDPINLFCANVTKCVTDDLCKIASCNSTAGGICEFTDKCIPPNECSFARCVPSIGNCEFFSTCLPPDACHIANCTTGGGCDILPKCPDPVDPCFLPKCTLPGGTCSTIPKCAPVDDCTPAICFPGGICNTNSSCVSMDPCQVSECINGGCQTRPLCVPENDCQLVSCNMGVCNVTLLTGTPCEGGAGVCLNGDCDVPTRPGEMTGLNIGLWIAIGVIILLMLLILCCYFRIPITATSLRTFTGRDRKCCNTPELEPIRTRKEN